MKIYKKPKIQKIKCECGCVFRPSHQDICSEYLSDGTISREKHVLCPVCSRHIPVTFKGRRTGICAWCKYWNGRDKYCTRYRVPMLGEDYCSRFDTIVPEGG